MSSYTGIGSRETPADVRELMSRIAIVMGERGVTLRSGGAEGADTAFYLGAVRVAGPREIYIPWDGFNGMKANGTTVLHCVNQKALDLAAEVHPNWAACSQGAKQLHARNGFQVLGRNLDDPSSRVVCWTPGGKGGGGTGQALRIARAMDIPIDDLGDPEVLAMYQAQLQQLNA